jgi:phenylalanyl-tRNA synthetase alpha chain
LFQARNSKPLAPRSFSASGKATGVLFVLEELEKIEKEAFASLSDAKAENEVYEIRVRVLGKKGSLTQVLKRLGTLPESVRKETGKKANQIKEDLEKRIEETLLKIQERERREAIEKERIDVTLPGREIPLGKKHPLTQTLEEIIDIFSHLGFEVVEGPEVELDYYNFEALNIPKGHPAREMQATFFISDDVVLRTHTSPMQVRTMEKKRPPVRMICPGAVYRCDSDPTHSPMFNQVEGLLVDRGITFGDLKGVLTVYVRQRNKAPIPTEFFPFHRTECRGRYRMLYLWGERVRSLLQYGMVRNPGIWDGGPSGL